MNICSSDQLQQQHPSSQQTSDALLIANTSKPGLLCAKVESTTRGSTPSKGCSCFQEEVEEGRLSVASSVSASGSWNTETSVTKGCNHRATDVNMWSHTSSACSSKETLQRSHSAASLTYGKFPDLRSKVPCNPQFKALFSRSIMRFLTCVECCAPCQILALSRWRLMVTNELGSAMCAPASSPNDTRRLLFNDVMSAVLKPR